MKHCFLICLFLCIAGHDGFSQSDAAVLMLSKKFNDYHTSEGKTKLLLVLNQNKFSAGDTIWFKCYILNNDLSPVLGKQWVELNLVDANAVSKLSMGMRIDNGIGYNQLYIPDTLAAGFYLLAAQSSNTNNSDHGLIYKKEIEVVKQYALMPFNDTVVKVFPEGGHLIATVQNKVIIRSRQSGDTLRIVNAEGQELAQAITDSNNLAALFLTPTKNTQYFFRINDEANLQLLPATKDKTYSLQVEPSQNKGEPVNVNIHSTPVDGQRDEELILVLSARHRIYHIQSFIQAPSNSVSFQLPQQNLPEGIVKVSLLRPNGELVSSRDFYSPGNDQVIADIQTEKIDFQTREKVNLEISIKNSNGEPISAEFSIKVLNGNLFKPEIENTLSDELHMLSYLQDRFIINKSAPDWFGQLDYFMITATLPEPWEEILSPENRATSLVLNSKLKKTGRAYYSDTNEPLPEQAQIMFYLQQSNWRYQREVMEGGRIELNLPELFRDDELFYLAESKNGEEISNVKVEWENKAPVQLPQARLAKETKNLDPYSTFIQKSKLIDQSYGFYTSDRVITGNTASPNESFEKLVKGVDVEINFDDFIRFSTMEELIKEVIPPIYHRRTGQTDIVRVKLLDPMKATADPLYIIDGIATKNTAFFLSLNPLDLISVKIVNSPKKLLPLGLLGKNGIVMIESKRTDLREPLTDASKRVEGLSKPISFTNIEHFGFSAQKPDFRSTIFWNPSIQTNDNGKAFVAFFCSDDVGVMNIHIEGITADGKVFSVGKEIKVSLAPDEN